MPVVRKDEDILIFFNFGEEEAGPMVATIFVFIKKIEEQEESMP